MKWYDFFSNFYDNTLEKLYFESRERAVGFLDLSEGQTVLDVACGTGANFKHIKKSNNKVTIYGTDFSEGMLRRGEKNIRKAGWEDIHLFQSDARHLSPEVILEKTGEDVQIELKPFINNIKNNFLFEITSAKEAIENL